MGSLLTTAKAAKKLLVSPARVRQIIAGGQLRAIKVGRDHVIEVSDLEEYIASPKEKVGRPKKILVRAKETDTLKP